MYKRLELGRGLFTAVGVDSHEADLVADHMVESGLLGHDSHSVLRFPHPYRTQKQHPHSRPGPLPLRRLLAHGSAAGNSHRRGLNPHDSMGLAAWLSTALWLALAFIILNISTGNARPNEFA